MKRQLVPPSTSGSKSASEQDQLWNIVIGGTARTSAGLCLMPMTVVKARYESSLSQYKDYRSIWGALTSIVRNEGGRALFAGFGSTALRDAPYAGLYLMFYEEFKVLIDSQQRSLDTDYNRVVARNLIASSCAGLVSTFVTHPFDVLRTRIQLEPKKYRNSLTAMKIIWKSGKHELMAGLTPRLIRKTLSSAITWTLYEHLKTIFAL